MCYLGQVTGLLHLKVNYLQNMKVGLLNDFSPTQLCTVCCSPNEILNRGQHVTHQNCGRGGLGEPKAPVLNLLSPGKAPEASLETLRALCGVGKKTAMFFKIYYNSNILTCYSLDKFHSTQSQETKKLSRIQPGLYYYIITTILKVVINVYNSSNWLSEVSSEQFLPKLVTKHQAWPP